MEVDIVTSELESRVRELEEINTELEARAGRLRSVLEITNLQSRYNLWLEMGYYERIWDELFSHDNPQVSCEIGESGVYEGPASVERLWKALANRERPRGYMANIMVMNPYIVLSKDGNTAKGMWWAFGPHADYATPYPGDGQKLTAYWFCGKYDNRYIKEGGKWKFLSLHTIIYMRTPFDQGWLKQSDCVRWQVPEGAPADRPPTLLENYHAGVTPEWKPYVYPYEPII
jgi:hypothetical protein